MEDVATARRGASGRLIKLDGPSGVGKTWQARTIIQGLPELGIEGLRTLVATTERKLKTLEDLEGKFDYYVIDWCDYPDPRDAPRDDRVGKRYTDFINDPRRNLFKMFWQLRNEEHPYECLYIDSGMRWSVKLLFEITGVNDNPDSRSDYIPFARRMKLMLDHLASLTEGGTKSGKPLNVVMTFGVDPEVDPIEGIKKVMSAVDGTKIAPVVNYYFDDVFSLRTALEADSNVPGGFRTVYTLRTAAQPQVDAKVSSAVALPPVIASPNLFKIMCILDGKLEMPQVAQK